MISLDAILDNIIAYSLSIGFAIIVVALVGFVVAAIIKILWDIFSGVL